MTLSYYFCFFHILLASVSPKIEITVLHPNNHCPIFNNVSTPMKDFHDKALQKSGFVLLFLCFFLNLQLI